ncbi:MAG: virulence RhuM family protein [Armatimonadota bacterium]
MANEIVPSTPNEFVIYQTEDGLTRVSVRFEGETVWLTQGQMVELFQSSKANISEHIKHVFEEGELDADSVVRNFRTTAADGKSYNVAHYNLDVIISVGYRVKSLRGTQFRIWATQRLREYIVKGFTMDDERLKEAGGGDYFDELLERIRDIRSSERVFWRKVLDIYATSVDYDPNVETSKRFFQTVQNKMHWAIAGQTAAEIVHTRADADKPNMGLMNWTGDRPRKGDVCVAKNYLCEEELKALNLIVSAYLDFAELQAVTRKPMTMASWIAKLDDFIRISDRDILNHAGTISHEAAKLKAELEYEKYRKAQAALPQPVDRHFVEAVDELEKLEAEAKKRKPRRGKKGGAQ